MAFCYYVFISVMLVCNFHHATTDIASHSDLFAKYCPYQDQCTRNATKFVPENGTSGLASCCLPCRCDRLCTERDDCCPDVLLDKPADTDIQQKCTVSQYPSPGGRNRGYPGSYLMWTGCKGHTDLQTKCLGNGSLEEMTVVSDLLTGIIYRNRFCAMCHNASKILVRWKMFLLCPFKAIPRLGTELHSLHDIYNYFISNKCLLELEPPNGLRVKDKKCTDRSNYRMRTCMDNNPEQNMKQLCEQKFSPLLKTSLDGRVVKFANVYCVHCSTTYFDPDPELCESSYFSKSHKTLVSFSAILNLDAFRISEFEPMDGSVADGSCSRQEIFDSYKNVCRRMYCPMCRQPNYGMCDVLCETNHTYWYEYSLRLEGLPGKSLSKVELTTILEGIVGGIVQKHLLYESNYVRKLETGNASVIIMAAILSLTHEKMVEVSKVLLSSNLAYNVGEIGNKSKWNVSLSPYYHQINRSQESLPWHFIATRFNKCLYCRQIVLNNSDVYFANGTLVLLHSGRKLNAYEYNMSVDGSVRVCIDDYFGNVSTLTVNEGDHVTKPHVEKTQLARAVVSTVCTTLSITCVLAVLGTYLMFDELRNTFGNLLMIFCLNVLSAQTFFQFGAGQTYNSSLCMVLGMLIHFWWLCVFTSKSACIFHVYQTIVETQNRTGRRSLPKRLLMLIYIPPVAIVLTCTVFTFIDNENFQIGYGGKVCFLNSILSFKIFFYGPLLLIISINTTISIVSIYKVNQTSANVMKGDYRKHILIYLRFTVFTGLTWGFGFLYIVTSTDIFEYLFLLFNCSVGIHVFASFILKKRTLSLYSERLRKQNLQSTQTQNPSITRTSTKVRWRKEDDHIDINHDKLPNTEG